MKNNVKALIACAAALAVVGGGYAALMLTGDKDSDTGSSAQSSQIDENSVPTTIFEFEKSDIQSVSVKNAAGEYKGIPVGKPAEDGTVTFTIEGMEDLDINNVLTSSLLNSASALNSEATAEENPSDLGKYGLISPSAEVTVKTGTGEKTLLVGDKSPIQGQTYCMEKNGNTVYLAADSNVSVFLNGAEDYISKTILEQPSEEDMPKIEEIRINRTDLEYDIVLNYDESSDDENSKSGTLATHYMSEPIVAFLDSEKSQTAVSGFFGLAAESVMIDHPTKDEIAASGLDEPFCTVTMKTDEPAEYVLKLGSRLDSEAGSSYLAMIDGKDVIYTVSPDSVCWAELQPGDITSKMVFGTYVWDIGRLDINVNGGENVSFEGKGSDESDYVVTKNGKSCDTERFRTFYTFLLKTSAEEFALGEDPEGEPIVSIELETQDKKTKKTVEFYKADGKKAYISVDGTPCFKCRMAYVDLLKDNLSKFDGSEEFVMNW
ncbi:MAG: DUF4340 domain-containing protein [Clostridium sp.]|nr:DUF4340 domain-containing protein [Clostridium sp.]MCM1547465.1 DUF4340 domain-containing protein [Ruminococcus sp.]